MKIFEFHFNPKAKSDLIFDSFCYEPETFYEKKLGNLYMAGLLKNALPQNAGFLAKLAGIVNEKYYKAASSASQEKALREALRKTNEYLEKTAKESDVSWLGNLNFTIVSLKEATGGLKKLANGFDLHFTKVGNPKLLLIRSGHLIDIEREIKYEGIEPYPLKIFGNIVSGKLEEGDELLILTKEVYDAFLKEKLFREISLSRPENLKDVFSEKNDRLMKTPGLCLAIVATKETQARGEDKIFRQNYSSIFSFKKLLSPLLSHIPLRSKSAKASSKKPPLAARAKQRPKKTFLSKIDFRFFKLNPGSLSSYKNALLILGLILFLLAGFFIFKAEQANRLAVKKETFSQIKQKAEKAETFLIIMDSNPQARKEAILLLGESWQEISVLTKESSSLPKDFSSQVLTLKGQIGENLYKLNKAVDIENPEIFFEFKNKDSLPQKIVYSKGSLYLFGPLSEKAFSIDSQKKLTATDLGQKFNASLPFSDSVLLFSKPNLIAKIQNSQLQKLDPLKLPYNEADFDFAASYQSNLYFLDIDAGQITKYPYKGNMKWETPQIWLKSEKKKFDGAKSITADQSIYVLQSDNSIDKYYAGKFKTTIKPDIFPAPESLAKVFTSAQLPYLYLLEPKQNRLVVLDKTGLIVKQYTSGKFDNLLDFAISDNGKTIYILNGSKVYILKEN